MPRSSALGRILQESIAAGQTWFTPLQRVFALTELARIHQARGDGAAALATIDEAERRIAQGPAVPGTDDHVAAHRARLWLVQGRLAAAVTWADRITPERARAATRHPYLPTDVVGPTVARVRLAQGRLDEAHRLLSDLRRAAEAAGLWGCVIELLVLQALTASAHGRRGAAGATLGEALALAEPEGYVRLFADEGAAMATLLRRGLESRSWGHDSDEWERRAAYARSLLAAFEAGRQPGSVTSAHDRPTPGAPTAPQPMASLIEPLSEREREVLRLVAAGHSNAEIARDLIVELSTVKTHLNNLYGKLGVHTRTQALARARKLGLLE